MALDHVSKLAEYIVEWLEMRNGQELLPAMERMSVGDRRRLLAELQEILIAGGKPPNWL